MKSLVALLAWVAICGGRPEPRDAPPSELPYYGLSPPVYPSPITNGSTSPAWAAAYAGAAAVVAQMTTAEKANLTRGYPIADGGGPCVGNSGSVPRLDIPSLCFMDGPAGIRNRSSVSAFPAGIHVAATFDADLMYRYGRVLGSEFAAAGAYAALGPLAGPLGRIARGGRNWEGLGSDPYLAGRGMGAITRGMQDSGVVATPKHFLLNEQEFRRRAERDGETSRGRGEALSADPDDRTLHELYAFPFMDALRAGAGGVMCSYNRANQSYACQNSKLLNGVLKTELGFEGFVVSDWDAQESGVASANAGLDVVMPGAGFWGPKLVEAVNNGSVSEERLDDMAVRVLAPWYLLCQGTKGNEYISDDAQQRQAVLGGADLDTMQDHAALIRAIGAAGTVLVKNDGGALPLRNPRFLCVYGYDATVGASPWTNPDRFGGGYDVNAGWAMLNGTLITGGGSGSNTPPYVISPFHAISERAARDRANLRWDFYSQDPTVYPEAEACLVFINAYASETFDRAGLADDFSDTLVLNVADKCASTIVVVHSAGIRLVDAWISHPNVTAVLFAGLPGQESGHAIADILYGDVNPSGRLPYTVARREEDYGPLLNSSLGGAGSGGDDWFPADPFAEGLLVDYRAFDARNLTPRFEFGFGLSYTSFTYGELSAAWLTTPEDSGSTAEGKEQGKKTGEGDITAEFPDAAVRPVQGGHPALWEDIATVRCSVTNTGGVPGREVAQLYVRVPAGDTDGDDNESPPRHWPVRQLRGISRTAPLRPGEVAEAEFALTRRDLSVWDVAAQQWRLRRGRYRLWVGASSRNLRLEGELVI